MKKTNAARSLDRLKISYEIIDYEIDEYDLSAVHVASTLGQEIESVFKTLVLLNENNSALVACIPANKELNLKILAKIAKCKKCTMLPMKELLRTTGYIRGGCSPLGMKKSLPTFIDQSAMNFQQIFVSAGIRGKQLHLNPNDLQNACKAIFASLV